MIVQGLSQLKLKEIATKKNLNHPSFFKIMIGDFSTKLRVPPAFVKNLKVKNLPLNFTISLGGTSWKVKVERSCDDSGNYYFTKGWRKIVKDLELAEGDFLVFYLVAEDAFQLGVYDPTCCHKKITLPPTTANGRHGSIMQGGVKEEMNKEERNQKKRGRSFVKTLAPYHKSFCTLPLWFVRETGLCNKKEIVIKDRVGRKWRVKSTYRLAAYRRYDLTTGWSYFIRDNGLSAGDTIKLKHIKGCMFALKVSPRRN